MAPPTLLKRFNPPGFLKDLKSEEALQSWSDQLSGWMDGEIAGDESIGRTPLKQFFNGTKTPYDQTADPVHITWIGFPKLVHGSNDEDRWRKADASRDVQDEYLEWSILRDDQGNIKSVTYTCEGPEYWEHLGRTQPEETFALIKELNAPYLDKASMSSFFKKVDGNWEYDRTNQFNNKTNTGIIINLFQRNNTLGAEVDIAAQGTVVRKKGNRIVTDKDELIRCSQYGSAGRNSDPKIGSDINAAARKGWTVSVADPVALYMQSFDTSNLFLDTSGNRDGTTKKPIPDSWMSLQGRGSGLGSRNPLALRLRIRNETGQKTADGTRELDVSDIWDDATQNNIRFGAQFADVIQMGVAGVLGTKGSEPGLADAMPCYRPPATAAANGVSAMSLSADAQKDGGKPLRHLNSRV